MKRSTKERFSKKRFTTKHTKGTKKIKIFISRKDAENAELKI